MFSSLGSLGKPSTPHSSPRTHKAGIRKTIFNNEPPKTTFRLFQNRQNRPNIEFLSPRNSTNNAGIWEHHSLKPAIALFLSKKQGLPPEGRSWFSLKHPEFEPLIPMPA